SGTVRPAAASTSARVGLLGSLARGRNREVAILHRPMIALQHDRARLLLIAVERAARRARNVRLADDRLAVQHDRYSASHERDVVGLPLVRALRRILIGNEESVDRAEPTCVLRAAHYRVFDLRRATAPQIDAAGPLRRVLQHHIALEV